MCNANKCLNSQNNSVYKVRVRFAPSPTGHLHIGGLRCALFNFIFARQHKGCFLLRIEDTDAQRSLPIYTQGIIDAFAWCGMASDEPLLFQSERKSIYQKHLDVLIEKGFAYWVEELNEETGLFSLVCKINVKKYGRSEIAFNDVICGHIVFNIQELEDFIIVRSDGTFLYNFVVVVDDILMNISHVIRGQEHISNTPKQLLLYEGIGAVPPIFAHLPLIMGQDGKKLSKRDAATAVVDYKYEGFLPEALCMYLIRLGWSYKDQEIFTDEQLQELFRLEDVHGSSAMFDIKKLESINNYYIKKYSAEYIYNYCQSNGIFWVKEETLFSKDKIIRLMSLYKDRMTTLKELYNHVEGVLHGPSSYTIYQDDFYWAVKNSFLQWGYVFINECKALHISTENEYKSFCEAFVVKHGIDKKLFFTSLRYALFNVLHSPSVFSIMAILGAHECIKRCEECLVFLKNVVKND